jgi:hypothetical protein
MKSLDAWTFSVMSILAILTVILLAIGDRTLPQVKEFSWQDRSIGAADVAFTLKFNRPVDRVSVERGIQIQPPLPGRISWAGQKMAYTLNTPAAYGRSYDLTLTGAKEALGTQQGKELVPFRGNFRTPDGILAYIGSEGEQQGRLLLYNFQSQTTQAISPPQLMVTDFKTDAQGQQMVFSAIDRQSTDSQQPFTARQQIYRTTAGMRRAAGQSDSNDVELVLDNLQYQNLKFDLSADGKKLVIQRLERNKISDLAMWAIDLEDRSAPPLKLKHSGDFVITPDSTAVAAASGQGVSINPLTKDESNTLDFLPKFGTLLSFTSDGNAATVIKFNTDYTKSLFVVNNIGTQKEVLKTNGSILDAKFTADGNGIFCLVTDLKNPTGNAQEQPYVTYIDLVANTTLPLFRLPNQQGIQISLSPDGLALAFDRAAKGNNLYQVATGEDTANLWLYPIPAKLKDLNDAIAPVRLPFPGWHPRWIP